MGSGGGGEAEGLRRCRGADLKDNDDTLVRNDKGAAAHGEALGRRLEAQNKDRDEVGALQPRLWTHQQLVQQRSSCLEPWRR